MCSSPSVPAAQVPEEPMKNAAAKSAEATDAAAREQALRRGLASTYTRNGSSAAQAKTIGG